MGNCLNRRQRAMTWVDEEGWDTTGSGSPRRDDRVAKLRRKSLLRREDGGASSSLVKIRITKKQWEELVSGADMQGVDVHRVLSRIMGRSRSCIEGGGRQWRPSLQSIPEDAESEVDIVGSR
ncbi:hypothetical protein MUK42_35998 [Musa troglodytarum]|uniref:Uncharacterized protein n=1 Tax=Musa troglodytarum TaxID=320322 RepID=A0A9E7KZL3_9LILI|nr:hypothetical protein MUK42_35998 [Musa troglodytarum]